MSLPWRAKQVVAKRKVDARTWDCCGRLNEVLAQVENWSREVQGYISFSALDVLDYLRQEGDQPNDHDHRILTGDSGTASPDGLALLLSSVTCAEMGRHHLEGEGCSSCLTLCGDICTSCDGER